MSGEAKIDVVGNLGGDPEMKYRPQGDPIAEFSIANTPFKRQDDGSFVDGDTVWYRVSAWRKDAERVVENLQKGDRVRVTGMLKPSLFEGKEGDTRMSLQITADSNGVTKVLKATPQGDDNPWNGA
jgi:single-strand DNA-binding protein